MQGDGENSDTNTLTDSHRSEKFSAMDSGENFIRYNLLIIEAGSAVNKRPAGTGPSF
jgi:hypothetical protein